MTANVSRQTQKVVTPSNIKLYCLPLSASSSELHYFFSNLDIPEWTKALSLSELHIYTQLSTPQSVGLLCTSDQPDADVST
jgi:hypothetical protein